MKRRLIVLAAVGWLASCAPSPTQIIVHVDAERLLRNQTEQLRIRVWGRDADALDFEDRSFQVETAPTNRTGIEWPWRVDLQPRDGDGSRVWRIEAAAYSGAAPPPDAEDIRPNLLAVSRTIASYDVGRVRHVFLLLYDACIAGDPCVDPNTTCSLEGCVNIGEPRFFDPEAGPPDAGRSDAGRSDAGPGCVPADEACNGRDDDCDTRVDEDFDFTGVDRCGSCGTVCQADNTLPRCDEGTCRYSCQPGYLNCDDGEPDCETPVNALNCGRCNNACMGTEVCRNGSCVDDCGALTECARVCVDTALDPSHCGGCNRPCDNRPNAVRSCMDGMCHYTCMAGYDDCNRDLHVAQGTGSDGCEANLADLDDCERCGGCIGAPSECHEWACMGGSCQEVRQDDGTFCMGSMCSGVCEAGRCEAMCPGPDGGPDAGPDGGPDAGPDGGPDAGPDGGPDGGPDAGPDGGPDGGVSRDGAVSVACPPGQPECGLGCCAADTVCCPSSFDPSDARCCRVDCVGGGVCGSPMM